MINWLHRRNCVAGCGTLLHHGDAFHPSVRYGSRCGISVASAWKLQQGSSGPPPLPHRRSCSSSAADGTKIVVCLLTQSIAAHYYIRREEDAWAVDEKRSISKRGLATQQQPHKYHRTMKPYLTSEFLRSFFYVPGGSVSPPSAHPNCIAQPASQASSSWMSSVMEWVKFRFIGS